jgi:hypothetical protein
LIYNWERKRGDDVAIVFFICILAKLWFARMDWMTDFHVGHALLELSPLVAAYAAFMLFPWPARFRLTMMLIADAALTVALVATSLYVHGHGDLPSTSGMRVLASVGEVRGALAHGFNFVYLLYFFNAPLFLLMFALGRPLELPWVKTSAKTWMSVFMIAALLFCGQVWMQWRDGVRLPIEQARAHGVLSYAAAEVLHAVYDGQETAAGKVANPIGFAAAPRGANVVVIGVRGLRSRDLGRSADGQVLTPGLNAMRAEAVWTSRFDGTAWAKAEADAGEDGRLADLGDWRMAGLTTATMDDDFRAYARVDVAGEQVRVEGRPLIERLLAERKAGKAFYLHLQVDKPSLRAADDEVGALLALLDAYDFTKRTVVVVYGDTARAPLFVRIPGMPAVRLRVAADAAMVMPTVANVTGRRLPDALLARELFNK